MVLGDALAPRAPPKPGNFNVNGISLDSGIISREVLLDMSRGRLKRYLIDGSEEDQFHLRNVQLFWEALLTTICDSSVVDGHMTAVCNALCVFLQSASSSSVASIQTFAMSEKIWTKVFEVLLDEFDGGKLKPLRQVLNTLIKILGQHADRDRTRAIQDGILVRMAAIVLLGKPRSQLKASMIIFETFVRSGVPVSRILRSIGRAHGSSHEQWDQRLRRQRIDAIKLTAAMKDYTADESICHFTFAISLAIAESNLQATAGTFFAMFISMLTAYSIPLGSSWIEFVVITLHRYPQAMEAFKNHLLPSILKLQPGDFYNLLDRMFTSHTNASLFENALTIAVVGRNAGLEENGT